MKSKTFNWAELAIYGIEATDPQSAVYSLEDWARVQIEGLRYITIDIRHRELIILYREMPIDKPK